MRVRTFEQTAMKHHGVPGIIHSREDALHAKTVRSDMGDPRGQQEITLDVNMSL